MSAITPPEERANLVGHMQDERALRRALDAGRLHHGWLITGAPGVGKATLAYRVARAALAPAELADGETLAMAPDARAFRLIAQKAHPDLCVVGRKWDDKKERYSTDIPVSEVRNLIDFMNRTAALGGFRAAIIDAADDLNRSAANALLKVLEEPPEKTLILVLANAPGRLLPTIRSRCRRLDLRAVDDDLVRGLLIDEAQGAPEEVDELAALARGRPGYAMQLAAEDGVKAGRLTRAFLSAAAKDGEFHGIGAELATRTADDAWRNFRALTLEALAAIVRARAAQEEAAPELEAAHPAYRRAPVERLADAWEKLGVLADRGDALHLDRVQLVLAMGLELRDALRAA